MSRTGLAIGIVLASLACTLQPTLNTPALGAAMTSAMDETDLPPEPQTRIVRIGKRLLNVSLSMSTTLPGTIFEGQQVFGTTNATVTVTSADGLPLPPLTEIPRLYYKRGSRWIRIPLQWLVTTAMQPQEGPSFIGTAALPIPGGSVVPALVQVKAGKSWGRADYRSLPVWAATPVP